MEVTRDNRKTGEPWAAPYCDITGADAGPDVIDSEIYHPWQPQGYMKFKVKDAVENWRSGDENYGLLILAHDETKEGRDLRFRSKEDAGATPAFIDVLCN